MTYQHFQKLASVISQQFKQYIFNPNLQLPPSTTWVNINAAGYGIGIVQLSWSYNVEVAGPWPLFNVDPQVDKTSNSNQLHLSICTHSTGEESNMAVMEVNVPTGYSLNTDRLTNLLHYPQVFNISSIQVLLPIVNV